MDDEKAPKVSVCVVTYNHEKYIRQCLQSLVDQKTNFAFEVIVGEDCSTDGTRAIVQKFAENYPEIVKPIFHEKNVGGNVNYFSVHGAALGEYIAHLDGDDYALPGKLNVLANVLDSRPDVNVVWHRMKVLNNKSGLFFDDLIDTRLMPESGFTRADMLACGTLGAHSAKMYRAILRDKIEIIQTTMMDNFVTLQHIDDGKALWVDYVGGVYRANVGAMVTATNDMKILFINHWLFFINKFPSYRAEINALASLLLLTELKNGRRTFINALKLWIKSFTPRSIILFFKYLPLYRILRLPTGAR